MEDQFQVIDRIVEGRGLGTSSSVQQLGIGYNLDEEKNKMSRPPKACGYQIQYPYMVMPMDMQDVQMPRYSKKIERAKEREIQNLQLRNSHAKAKLQKLLELTHL
jgi:hypothetical protein